MNARARLPIPADTADDALLSVSRWAREADPVREWPLGEALRLSLELLPMEDAPKEGTSFTAYLLSGKRVQTERFDEGFVTPDNLLEASDFAGWLAGSEERHGPAIPVHTDRQEAWDDQMEIEGNEAEDRFEDDRDALASAGWEEE